VNSGQIGQLVAMGGSGKTQDFFSRYEVCIIYILTKFMQFLYIKHEHSHMSFQKKVSYVWIFKILNPYQLY
jgi:hypothetical protein